MGRLFSPGKLFGPKIVFGSSPRYRVGRFGPLSPLAVKRSARMAQRVSQYVRYKFYRMGYLSYKFALSSQRHVIVRERVSHLGGDNRGPRLLRALSRLCQCSNGQAYTNSNLYTVSYPVNVGANSLARVLHRTRFPPKDANCETNGFTTGRFTKVGDALHPMLSLTGTTRDLLKASAVASVAQGVRDT